MRVRPCARGRLRLFVCALPLLLACKKSGAGVADAGPAPSASVSQQAAIEQASTDQKWIDARDADPLELARLADAVGADELAAVAGDASKDESDRQAAIRALGFVDDPTPALETLARLAAGGGTTADLALETIADVAPKQRPIEEVEPTAWRACAQALLAAAPTVRDPARRARLLAALIALSNRGAIDASAIPAE